MIERGTSNNQTQASVDAFALPDFGSGGGGFLFNAAKGDIVSERKRFELRITDEDRQRLRALAEQTTQNESDAIRALIRGANISGVDESREAKEEAVAA